MTSDSTDERCPVDENCTRAHSSSPDYEQILRDVRVLGEDVDPESRSGA